MDLPSIAMGTVLLLAAVAFFARMIYVATSPTRAARAWEAFTRGSHSLRIAARPGDGISYGLPALEGTFRDVPVFGELYRKRLTIRSDPTYRTRVVARCRRPLPMGFALERQGALSSLLTMLGEQDLRVGDAAFDDKFVVGGIKTDAVRALLADPAVRATLVRLIAREPHLRVEGGEVAVERRGAVTKAEDLTSMLDVASVAALALEHAAAVHVT